MNDNEIAMDTQTLERLTLLTKANFYYDCGCHDSVREIDDWLIKEGYAILIPVEKDDPLKGHCPHIVGVTVAGHAALKDQS